MFSLGISERQVVACRITFTKWQVTSFTDNIVTQLMQVSLERVETNLGNKRTDTVECS